MSRGHNRNKVKIISRMLCLYISFNSKFPTLILILLNYLELILLIVSLVPR